MTAEAAAGAVTGIVAGLNALNQNPTLIIGVITDNLKTVVAPESLSQITGLLNDLAGYGNDMLAIGILYIIRLLFNRINGSPEAQPVFAHAPLPQPGSNPVVDLVRDGGVGVYNALIDLINVLLAKPGSVIRPGMPVSPNTQASNLCLSSAMSVLSFTGNNQAYEGDARQKAIQYLNNTRHLLRVLFPEWAGHLQEGNIATAIKNGADLVELFKGQILVYVDDPTTFPPGTPPKDDVLACFPMLSVSLTPQALRRHEASDPLGIALASKGDDQLSRATQASSASSVMRRGENYLPLLQRALLEYPSMLLTPDERAGLDELKAADNPAARAATTLNNWVEGLVIGVQMGARLLCYPLQLAREPIVAMLEQPVDPDSEYMPSKDHPFIPDSMLFLQRFAKEHELFIDMYREYKIANPENDPEDADIQKMLNTVFKNNKTNKTAYIAALKLAALWGPTHNKVKYVMLMTKGGSVKPFIVLEGAIVGKVARIPLLQHEDFGDVLPVETENMIVSTVSHIKDTVSSSVRSGFSIAASVCSTGFSRMRTWGWRQPVGGTSSSSLSLQEQGQNDVDLVVVTGISPPLQVAVSRAHDPNSKPLVVNDSQGDIDSQIGSQSSGDSREPSDSHPASGTPPPPPGGGVYSDMNPEGGSRRRRASTAKRNNRRKSHNKKSNKRKSRKQLSRKKISRRRQSRRK
jgi:hypothetical protein